MTEEAVEILRLQIMKNNALKVTEMEWSEFVFLCRKGTPVKNKTKRNRPDCGCFESGLIFFALENWYINWYINEMPKPAKPVKSRFTRKER